MADGNCQVSSTLYNAVLALPSLTVLERHEHSNEVYYVPLGKDAAVSYGSIDFKFRNDYDYDIKIYASKFTHNIVKQELINYKKKNFVVFTMFEYGIALVYDKIIIKL